MNLASKQGGHFKGIKNLLNLEAQHSALVKGITVSHGQSDCIRVFPENEAHLNPNKFQQ